MEEAAKDISKLPLGDFEIVFNEVTGYNIILEGN